MQTDGYVSLWISNEPDAAKVQAAFEVKYTDDGDWIAPPFAMAFGFTRFNPSTREANVLGTPTASVREAVAGFSYGSLVGERFARTIGETLPFKVVSVAMLYDFKFAGAPTSATVNGSTWTYLGSVRYVESMTMDEALARKLSWRKTSDVNHPWETVVDGHTWRLRLGDYPAEDLFTLIVDGREIGSFNNVPKTWNLGE